MRRECSTRSWPVLSWHKRLLSYPVLQRYGESGDTVKLKWRMLNTYALCVGGVSYATPAQDNFMALTMIRENVIFR